MKHYDPYSSNYKYKFKNQSTRLRVNRMVCRNFNRFLSSSEVSAPQTNPRGNDDENAKKLAKEAEEKAKKMKEINDDHAQTIAQLEVLKAQVKKVHDEMQARKYESWTVKMGKFVNNVGIFLTKIGPAIMSIFSMSRQDWKVKIAGWKKIILLELEHYKVGGRLLWADIKISARLLYKVAKGMNLTRRERQQLKRTTSDIFRLVPFAVILIVPFMEFSLPLLLKIFPNMLPSTFANKKQDEENVNIKLVARVQYAKFLKETVQDMAKELKKSPSGELRRNADELESFMQKVHTGVDVTNKEIISFAKLFNDELTLENITRPRLVSMCKYMNIQPYGTDAYLRYSLRNKLLAIKKDDREIQQEGVDSLSESELRAACRERGMLGIQSVNNMRSQLQDWLDLSLTHNVPSSLLILSRAFLVAGKIQSFDAVEATLSSLPDEVIASVDVSTKASELELEERKKRLEILQHQEELIKKGK
ncbi:hypothetical protein KC19_12G019100 [Ceratodon purpureus]|uniref:Letm1 RBD domain-containing protein n=1 Tax=Ceratodon purpureus TaxID=3225 RepID=A0A8T0G4Z9_CERPU|nr:hypothetical protein KC19_12G019100 [Ceratodon purpureus]